MRRQSGYVLLTAAAGVVVILGVLGLCLDLGRMYVAANELQTYSDAASIAACHRLDGTSEGIAAATLAGTQNVNKWSFGSSKVANAAVDFALNSAGPWVTSPVPASGYRFARVRAQSNVRLYFVPIFAGVGTGRAVGASAVAGQGVVNSIGDGAFPFSPDAHVPNPIPVDPTGNFGFIKGGIYTLRWDAVGKGRPDALTTSSGHKVVGCQDDMTTPGFIPGALNNGQRGYLDLEVGGGGGGAAFIRDAILGSVDVDPINVGDLIDNATGNKQTEVDALLERVAQDTNQTTATYYTAKAAGVGLEPPGRTYYAADPPGAPASPPRGNGRRLVVVPVNNPTTDTVLGFAYFFLPPIPCPEGNPQPCCAEYVGPSTHLPGQGGPVVGGGSLGGYRIRLFQ